MLPIIKTILLVFSIFVMFLMPMRTAIAYDFSISPLPGIYSTNQNILIAPNSNDTEIFLSCGNNSFSGSPLLPFTLSIKAPYEIVINRSAKLILTSSLLSGSNKSLKDYDIRWSASSGSITGIGNEVTYTAPSYETAVLITVTIDDRYGNTVSLSDCIFAHNQVVIIKADDYWISTNQLYNDGWNNFINYIETNSLKASIGLIGNAILSMGQNTLSDKTSMLQRGNIEFFDHGYDHGNGTNPDGSSWWEFWNTPQLQQQDHLTRFINLAKSKLNLNLRAFGAPGNSFDQSTSSLLNALPEFKIFYYLNAPPINSNKLLLKITSLEHNVPNFISTYDGTPPYIVYQVHPYTWDQTALNEFKQIIDILNSKNVRFMTSYNYYLNFHDSILIDASGQKWMKYLSPVAISCTYSMSILSKSRTSGFSSISDYNYVIDRYGPVLGVSITGAGEGAITSRSSDSRYIMIACMSGSYVGCSILFTSSSLVELLPTADINSVFSGWSGDCIGTEGCTVTMNGPRHVTAIFDKAVFIKNQQSAAGFSVLQDAYNSAENGNTVLIRSGITAKLGALTINRVGIGISLKGGYNNSSFTTQTDFSYVQSPLSLTNGSLIVDKLIVQ